MARSGWGGHPGTPEPGEGLGLGLPVQARKSGPDGGSGGCGSLRRVSFPAFLCSPVSPSIREDRRRANVSGMVGQSLTLECDANGFPAPEIVWLKNGQPVGVPWGGRVTAGILIGYGLFGRVPVYARHGGEM